MTIVALFSAALAIALHVVIFWMESIAWNGRAARKTFGPATPEEVAATHSLAFNQGFYNLFLAVIGAIGVVTFRAEQPGRRGHPDLRRRRGHAGGGTRAVRLRSVQAWGSSQAGCISAHHGRDVACDCAVGTSRRFRARPARVASITGAGEARTLRLDRAIRAGHVRWLRSRVGDGRHGTVPAASRHEPRSG